MIKTFPHQVINFLKKFLILFLIASFLLTSCAEKRSDPSKTSIIFGTTDSVTSLDPAGFFDSGSNLIASQIYRSLFTYDESGSIVNDLVEKFSWTGSQELSLTLKAGLTFNNGHELNASDVLFSLRRITNIKDPLGPSSNLSDIFTAFAQRSDLVINFSTTIPFDQSYKAVLAAFAGYIVDEEVFPEDKLISTDELIISNAFTGPYLLTTYDDQNYALLSKNSDYQGLSAQNNDTVEIKFFASYDNLKLSLQEGSIDFIKSDLNKTELDTFKSDSNLEIIEGEGGDLRFIVFNLNTMPFGIHEKDNENTARLIRQTIAQLIDREAISETIWGGMYQPLYSIIPPNEMGATEPFLSNYPLTDDYENLKKKLETASVQLPLSLTIEYNSDHYGKESQEEYNMIKSQLEKSGFLEVNLSTTEWSSYTKNRHNTSDGDGLYPIYQLGWSPYNNDPDGILSPLFQVLDNGWSNESFTTLLDQQRSQNNQEKRKATIEKIQNIIALDVPVLPLLYGTQIVISNKYISGIVLNSSNVINFGTISIN